MSDQPTHTVPPPFEHAMLRAKAVDRSAAPTIGVVPAQPGYETIEVSFDRIGDGEPVVFHFPIVAWRVFQTAPGVRPSVEPITIEGADIEPGIERCVAGEPEWTAIKVPDGRVYCLQSVYQNEVAFLDSFKVRSSDLDFDWNEPGFDPSCRPPPEKPN